ncbi:MULTISPECIES: hypothetical protein [unclassified Sphingomonas]|uniref:hypothetical protein n=1 Tax=unclassified Sphingomonas TaxID=196159 RepID=UPI0006F518FA|nr:MULTISPECIES: hypothetical protein [unclassified Sphingomonas]KQX18414.1 hypothetical protein ASD17_14730 [Sphingomonas sp. Root1294]KQY72261.1 hypothetical protein ASD39_20245 [Sphingomonas sp. Root50]KRB94468.1 hypothetical protein ASE22_00505 [Sphingomonas sp. Root720]
MKLTILTWLWRQPQSRTSFTAMHVNIWAAMVRRHCTLDIEIACVTDMPDGIDPSIRIITPPGEFVGLQTRRWRGQRPNCYRRLAMFRSDAAGIFGERFVCMDLDVVIAGNIDAILDRPEDLVICGPSQEGPRWRYNGSMLLMTAGARPHVYDDFSLAGAEEASRLFVGSDQAWLGYALGPGEATWSIADGVTRASDSEMGRIRFYPGHVKPWDELADAWVSEHYRMTGGRHGLVLGQKRAVWDEAREAMARDRFDGVIAYPAAAEKWHGPVDAIVESKAEVATFARMLGFDRLTVCGG